MLTKKAKYGLKALFVIAKECSLHPMKISKIAEREMIPRKFLELILLELKNRGIVCSQKGRGGGYSLGRPTDEIKLGEVVRVLSGPLAPVSCVSQTAYKKCGDCQDEASCGVRIIMQDVRDAISDILDRVSLQDILKRIDEASKRKRHI